MSEEKGSKKRSAGAIQGEAAECLRSTPPPLRHLEEDKEEKEAKKEEDEDGEASEKRFVLMETFCSRGGNTFHTWLQVNGNEKELGDFHAWLEADEERLDDGRGLFDIEKTESEEFVDTAVKYFDTYYQESETISVSKCVGRLVLPRDDSGAIHSQKLEMDNGHLYGQISTFFET